MRKQSPVQRVPRSGFEVLSAAASLRALLHWGRLGALSKLNLHVFMRVI